MASERIHPPNLTLKTANSPPVPGESVNFAVFEFIMKNGAHNEEIYGNGTQRDCVNF